MGEVELGDGAVEVPGEVVGEPGAAGVVEPVVAEVVVGPAVVELDEPGRDVVEPGTDEVLGAVDGPVDTVVDVVVGPGTDRGGAVVGGIGRVGPVTDRTTTGNDAFDDGPSSSP